MWPYTKEDVIAPYLLFYQHKGGLHIKISMGFVKAHVALHITYGLPCSISPCIHCHTGQVSIDITPHPLMPHPWLGLKCQWGAPLNAGYGPGLFYSIGKEGPVEGWWRGGGQKIGGGEVGC